MTKEEEFKKYIKESEEMFEWMWKYTTVLGLVGLIIKKIKKWLTKI